LIDYFKELVSAANSRVRSPVLGSIVLVFLALNWKEFFYVFFAETSVQVRLSYLEVNTDLWSLFYLPLLVGTTLAVLYPWINLSSSQLAKLPLRALKRMQGDEDHLRQIHSLENATLIEQAKAEFEDENDRRLLAAAERLKEAEDISSDAAKEFKKSRKTADAGLETSPNEMREYLDGLNDFGARNLISLSRNPGGRGGWIPPNEEI
jgi:hypothetical protein